MLPVFCHLAILTLIQHACQPSKGTRKEHIRSEKKCNQN